MSEEQEPSRSEIHVQHSFPVVVERKSIFKDDGKWVKD